MRSDIELLDHILNHIDNGTTDLGDESWFEPVENYTSQSRFDAERRLMRRLPVPFCPVAALPETGSYVARASAGVPLVVFGVWMEPSGHLGMRAGIVACNWLMVPVARRYSVVIIMAGHIDWTAGLSTCRTKMVFLI